MAGRRQDRPSIRPQNKVKRLPSIPDPVPIHVKPPEILINKVWRREREEGGGKKPWSEWLKRLLIRSSFLAVSRLMGLIATTNKSAGTPSRFLTGFRSKKNHQFLLLHGSIYPCQRQRRIELSNETMATKLAAGIPR